MNPILGRCDVCRRVGRLELYSASPPRFVCERHGQEQVWLVNPAETCFAKQSLRDCLDTARRKGLFVNPFVVLKSL